MNEHKAPELEEWIFQQLQIYLEEEARRLDAIDAANRESDPH